MRTIISTVLLVLTMAAAPAGAAEGHWQGVADKVIAAVGEVEARFAAGDDAGARKALTAAYFGNFEDSKMEAAIRKEMGQSRAVEVEGMFGGIRKAIKAQDKTAVQSIAEELRQALRTDGAALDAAKIPPEVFAVNQ